MTKHIHGGDVYKYSHCLDFSANCNPLGTPQSVKQAIIDSVDGLSDYPRVGCGPLKEAIAVYEQTQKEYLICGNGAADLMFSLGRAKNQKKALSDVSFSIEQGDFSACSDLTALARAL